MQESSSVQRMRHIAPELRGIARAICDADPTQFPELYATPADGSGSGSGGGGGGKGRRGGSGGAPPVAALQQLTTEVNDGVPLDPQQFRLFRAAYAECRQHLRGVPAGLAEAGTPLGRVLSLTSRLDALCTELALSLAETLPQLSEAHTFALALADADGRGAALQQLTQRFGGGELLLLRDGMLSFLAGILVRAVDALVECRDANIDYPPPRPAAAAGGGASSGVHLPPVPAPPPNTSAAADWAAGGRVQPPADSSAPAGGAGAVLVPAPPTRVGGGGLQRSPPLQPLLLHRSGDGEGGGSSPAVFRASVSVPLLGGGLGRSRGMAAAASSHHHQQNSGSSGSSGGRAGLLARTTAIVRSVNADLGAHLAHLQWLVGVMGRADFASFTVESYLSDASMQRAWSSHLGRGCPACSIETFMNSGIMRLFPAWQHRPMLQVLNFKKCGVVSLFTMNKLLAVWGPLLLLDRNLQGDLRSGVLALHEPFAYLEETLATRPGAQPGDFLVGLSDHPGEVRLAVLRPAPPGTLISQAVLGRGGRSCHPLDDLSQYSASTLGLLGDSTLRMGRRRSCLLASTSFGGDVSGYRRIGGGPGRRGLPAGSVTLDDLRVDRTASFGADIAPAPLRVATYRLSQDTGAWSVRGLTREEFDSIADACRAFPDVFVRACGDTWAPPESPTETHNHHHQQQQQQQLRLSDASRPASVAAQQQQQRDEGAGASSSLHRACFRNNTRYVRTLLTRGAGTVVNAAVMDTAVSSVFSWTPLLCAVNNPNSDPHEVVELLLNAGADARFSDDADCTALYYAVANGYAATAALLLERCPDLPTSPETVPLMVALGAHWYLPCERDVRRLADVVPSPDMMEALTAHVHDYDLCVLAMDILLDKLNAVTQAEGDAAVLRRVVLPLCPAGAAFQELHTAEELSMLRRLIAYSDRLCRQFDQPTRRAVQVLAARCYLLSWRARLREGAPSQASPSSSSSSSRGLPSGEEGEEEAAAEGSVRSAQS